MIITIAGDIGSGKSTVAKILAKKLGYKHYSTGDFMRQIAEQKGLSLSELSKLAEKNDDIDKMLDDRQKALCRKDKIVIDSRLGWHFIPRSIKVYLKVATEEGARRILKQSRHDERYSTINEAIKFIKERKISEIKRYKHYYNVNCYDEKNYDIVLDTTSVKPEDVANKIIQHQKLFK